MQGPSQAAFSLVGREPELSALERFFDADGTAQCLVLHGEPGIGKTALWQVGVEFARERGFVVLSAHGSEAEARLSFVGLADLLDDVDPAAFDGLPVPQRHALEVALRRAEPAGPPLEPLAISVGFLGALRLLAAERPLVVAVDDIQSVDRSSAESLAFAARRLSIHPVSFLLSRRAGPVSDLERVFADPERVYVEGLSFGAVNHLLSERLQVSLPRRVLRQLFDASQGNPLFALELGRALLEHGIPEIGVELLVPDVLDDLFSARVSNLAPPVQRALLAVALGGTLSGTELAQVADSLAIEDAVASTLLVAERTRFRPSHPLVAAAAAQEASARECRDLHLQLAGVVGDPALRARHLALAAAAPDRELALEVAAAAAIATERGAIQDAVELADHALRLTELDAAEYSDRVLVLAHCLHVVGDHPRATELLQSRMNELTPGRPRAEAYLLLGEAAEYSGEQEHLDRALAECAHDPGLRARALARRSVLLSISRVERIAEAEALARDALPDARAAGAEVERRVLLALAWARILQGRSIDDLREVSPSVPVGWSLYESSLDRPAGVRFAFRGELDQGRTLFRRMLALAEERGEARSGLVITTQLCELEMRAGDVPEVGRLLDEWKYWTGLEKEIETNTARTRLDAVHAALVGDAERANRLADIVIEAAGPDTGFGWDRLDALRASGLAAVIERNPNLAVSRFREVWDHTVREGVDDPGAFHVGGDLVESLAETGDIAGAAEVIERLRRLATEQEHPWGLATARRCTAVVQLAECYNDEAAAGLEAAAAAFGQLGLRFEQARCLLFLGMHLRRAKKRAAGRRTLAEAEAVFDEAGCTGWAGLTRSELARVSGRRRAEEGELTPAERHVAELAGNGLSNRDIAANLFISVYTVEAHLKSTYSKLGIRSRTQLAGRLGSAR